MAEVIFRLPGNAQFSYVEVHLDSQDVLNNTPEDTKALLEGALADLNAAYPDIQSAPAVAAPQVAAPAAAPTDPSKTCVHGARVYKTGTSAKGPWTAWMCPSKDRNAQCKPIWNN